MPEAHKSRPEMFTRLNGGPKRKWTPSFLEKENAGKDKGIWHGPFGRTKRLARIHRPGKKGRFYERPNVYGRFEMCPRKLRNLSAFTKDRHHERIISTPALSLDHFRRRKPTLVRNISRFSRFPLQARTWSFGMLGSFHPWESRRALFVELEGWVVWLLKVVWIYKLNLFFYENA